jgi:hypothetical protein
MALDEFQINIVYVILKNHIFMEKLIGFEKKITVKRI